MKLKEDKVEDKRRRKGNYYPVLSDSQELLREGRSGSDSMMDTPVPIPNTEVKHHNGEDSTEVRQ